MADKDKHVPGRSQRLTLAKFNPPDWYGWAGVLAMFLIVAVRIEGGDGAWFFPLLSLGEWLLLPLGVLSLTMGFLSLSRIREKTVLPIWLSAILPALLWLAAVGLSMLSNRVGPAGMDLILSWAVHLIFPSLAFLPLLTIRPWRDRLMWALAAGVIINVVAVFFQGRAQNLALPDPRFMGLGGFLANQHDFGVLLAVSLPLLAAWRGGDGEGPNKSLAVLFTTFLLPALALSACFTLPILLAATIGLLVAWAAWRSQAWILGVFLALLVVGYGAESRLERDGNQRRLLAESAMMCGDNYRKALNTFQVRPFLGSGPEAFIRGDGRQPVDGIECSPWYATLLGGTGLLGLGMWFVLLAELAARTMGRFGRRCLWHGGVLGGVAAMGALGLWTDCLAEGSGAMAGLLIALSILEEPETASHPFRRNRKNRGGKNDAHGSDPVRSAPNTPQPTENTPAAPDGRSGDTDIIVRKP